MNKKFYNRFDAELDEVIGEKNEMKMRQSRDKV